MKLSVSLYSLHPYITGGEMSVCDAIGFFCENGVKYVELLDTYLHTPAEEEAAHECLLNNGMRVSCYSVSNEFVTVDENDLQNEISKVQNACAAAKAFGTNIVRVFAGNLPKGRPASYEKYSGRIIDSLKQCAAHAESCGVVLCLENHGALAGRAEQVLHILNAVDSPALMATLDTGNFLIVDQDPYTAVRSLQGKIGHTHFKDMKKISQGGFTSPGGAHYIGTTLGEGEVDLKKILKLLYQSGYAGSISIEYEASGKDGCLENVAKSISYTRSLLERVSSL